MCLNRPSGGVRAAVAAVAIFSAAGAALSCAGGAGAHGSLSAEVHPKSGAPGSSVAVTGQSRTPGGLINGRWSTAGVQETGSGMASADGLFSFRITVPAVPLGVHYVLVAGPHEPVARTAFEVTEPSKNRFASGPGEFLLILALAFIGLASTALFRRQWRSD